MTPAEIMKGLQDKNRQLTMKNEELIDLAEAKAQAERDYKTGLAKEILSLKAEGQSVTLIDKLANGTAHIAELKMKFDIAEAVYNACREKIKDLRTAIDTYRSLLSFLKSEMEAQ